MATITAAMRSHVPGCCNAMLTASNRVPRYICQTSTFQMLTSWTRHERFFWSYHKLPFLNAKRLTGWVLFFSVWDQSPDFHNLDSALKWIADVANSDALDPGICPKASVRAKCTRNCWVNISMHIDGHRSRLLDPFQPPTRAAGESGKKNVNTSVGLYSANIQHV